MILVIFIYLLLSIIGITLLGNVLNYIIKMILIIFIYLLLGL